MRARYVFEHIMIPYLLDRRGGDFVSTLMMQKSRLVCGLCASADAKEEEEFGYKEEDFRVEAARLDADTVCITVTMPEPEETGDCRAVYVLADAAPFRTSFFTAERDGDGELLLCGQKGDVRLTFGRFGDESEALRLMLGVHKDNKDK